MKSFRWTFVALAVVIGLVVFTVLDTKRAEKNEELGEKEKSTLKIAGEKLTRIEIVNRVSSLILERPDITKAWRVAVPTDDLADPGAVQSFVASLESEKIIKVVVAGDELRKAGLPTYGLGEPLTRLKLTSVDGVTEEVRIGTVKAYDSNVYAQIDVAPSASGAEPRVLLLSSGWDVLLAKQPLDFRDKRLLRQDLTLSTLTRFTLKRGHAPELVVEKREKRWEITSGAVVYPLDEEKIGAFFDQLKGLRATAFLEAGDAKTSKELDDPALAVALFKDAAAPAFTARFAAAPAARASTAHAGKAEAEAARAARKPEKAADVLASSTDLKVPVKMSRGLFEAIDKTEQDFYDDKRPFKFTATDVEKIEIDSKEIMTTFTKKDGVWASVDAKGEPDGGKITDFLLKLGDLHAIRILRPDAKSALTARPSRIALRGADGGLLFNLSWGNSVRQPVGSYVVARTKTRPPALAAAIPPPKAAGQGMNPAVSRAADSMDEQMIGLAEADVSSLPIKNLFKEKPAAPAEKSPSPTPAQ